MVATRQDIDIDLHIIRIGMANRPYIEALDHKGSISKKFLGNDKNRIASFNGWFYHLDMLTVKLFLHHWNCLHKFFLTVV